MECNGLMDNCCKRLIILDLYSVWVNQSGWKILYDVNKWPSRITGLLHIQGTCQYSCCLVKEQSQPLGMKRNPSDCAGWYPHDSVYSSSRIYWHSDNIRWSSFWTCILSRRIITFWTGPLHRKCTAVFWYLLGWGHWDVFLYHCQWWNIEGMVFLSLLLYLEVPSAELYCLQSSDIWEQQFGIIFTRK
jgi:hypothetical protein